MYTENSRTLRREIKEDSNEWETPHIRGSENLILLKLKKYVSAGFFAEVDEMILKRIGNCKNPRIAKSSFEKVEGLSLPFVYWMYYILYS